MYLDTSSSYLLPACTHSANLQITTSNIAPHTTNQTKQSNYYCVCSFVNSMKYGYVWIKNIYLNVEDKKGMPNYFLAKQIKILQLNPVTRLLYILQICTIIYIT